MYSRLNPLIMVFRFQDSDSDFSLPFSSSDPTVLRLDNELFDATKGYQHITHLHVESLQFEEGYNKQYEADAGHTYSSADVRFYRLSAMLSDLSVHQVILYSQEPNMESVGPLPLAVKPLGWTTVVHPRRQMLMDTVVDVEDDKFVVQDGSEATAIPRIKKPYRTLKMVKGRKKSALQTAGSTVDFGFLYDVFANKQAAPANGETTTMDSEEVEAVIDRIKNLMEEDVEAEEVPRKTFMELAEHKINVSDVDASSSRFHDLFTSEIYNTPLELRRIASAQALHLPSVPSQDPMISPLYDNILQTWIAPLPVNIPARIRQSKEKLARRIAAEVVLASMRIHYAEPTPSIEQTAGSRVAMSQDGGVELPNLPSIQEESWLDNINITSSQPWLPSSQPFPTPPPSSFSQPAFPSSSALPTPEPTSSPLTSNPITRLSQHLKINNLAPEIPAGVGKVLAHWTSSTDPSTYDWEATTRALDQEEDGESQQVRDKARRKEERLRKRQRREEAIAQGRGAVESQPSPKFRETPSSRQFPRSSPGPVFGGDRFGGGVGVRMGGIQEGGGSSQVPLVQSQVEPGRHGGRPLKKKKPKMRVSGF
jgi:RNA polymerase I-specific transcription initiation factor RRN6